MKLRYCFIGRPTKVETGSANAVYALQPPASTYTAMYLYEYAMRP